MWNPNAVVFTPGGIESTKSYQQLSRQASLLKNMRLFVGRSRLSDSRMQENARGAIERGQLMISRRGLSGLPTPFKKAPGAMSFISFKTGAMLSRAFRTSAMY